MRSPVIAFSILAATVSPSLIAAAPTSPNIPGAGAITGATNNVPVSGTAASVPHVPNTNPLGFLSGIPTAGASSRKRANDGDTAGGNARTGNTASSDGGSIVNDGNEGTTLTNDDANFGGDADTSVTGDSLGGNGRGFGPGGNAYTGNSGPARGGTIFNSAGAITNDGANTPGLGGVSGTGDAVGGNAAFEKRALNSQTAGGNAQSGDSSNTSSGSVFQEAEDDGTVTNTASNQAGGDNAGDSFSGDALGGSGNNFGPGGNALSGQAGASNGGNIISEGGSVDNTGSNTASNGGTSFSGDATGGDVDEFDDLDEFEKRAFDADTAGGNAHTGDSSDVNGGNVANVAEPDGTITNTDSSFGGMGGDTGTGDAEGGNGNGRGPGGNASTGNSGNARGGAVENLGGNQDNTGGSNIAGNGGTSTTGTAVGGNVDGSRFEDDGFDGGIDDTDFGAEDFERRK